MVHQMSEVIMEVEFLYPNEGTFRGTILELMNEVYQRAAIFGTCRYRLIMEPVIVFQIEGGK